MSATTNLNRSSRAVRLELALSAEQIALAIGVKNMKNTKAELENLFWPGISIFDRCRVASEILADRDWIAREYGDYDVAQKAIQDGFFSDLAGLIGLGDLVAIYRAFPNEEQWKKYRYNVGAMHACWKDWRKKADSRFAPSQPPRRRATVKELDDFKERAENAERRIEQLNIAHSLRMKEIADLKVRISELLAENGRLRKENNRLQAALNSRQI